MAKQLVTSSASTPTSTGGKPAQERHPVNVGDVCTACAATAASAAETPAVVAVAVVGVVVASDSSVVVGVVVEDEPGTQTLDRLKLFGGGKLGLIEADEP